MELLLRLSDQISTYYNATGIPVQILGQNGELIEFYGSVCDYCALFQEACDGLCPCEQEHMYAFSKTVKSRDGYMFTCSAGYVHFALSVRDDERVINILAGPVALDFPKMELIDEVIRKYSISLNYRTKLFQLYSSAQLIEPYRARYLFKLLAHLVTNLEDAVRTDEAEANSKTQQEKVGQYIELVRQGHTMNLQYDMEKQLIEAVIQKDKEASKAILNEMLGRIYFTSANNIEIIKARSIELIALLSRAVIESGGSENTVYEMTDSSLHNISKVNDLTELSYMLLDILDLFSSAAFSKYKKTEVPALKEAVEYIGEHYAENISLEEVAEYVGLNPAYFSSLFKREMEINFSNYVTEKRMDAAKRMLKNSNVPLIEIAMSLGYENQSYFSSVFKKYCNMTPKQYRYSKDDSNV